jgi:hypothetical protein
MAKFYRIEEPASDRILILNATNIVWVEYETDRMKFFMTSGDTITAKRNSELEYSLNRDTEPQTRPSESIREPAED